MGIAWFGELKSVVFRRSVAGRVVIIFKIRIQAIAWFTGCLFLILSLETIDVKIEQATPRSGCSDGIEVKIGRHRDLLL